MDSWLPCFVFGRFRAQTLRSGFAFRQGTKKYTPFCLTKTACHEMCVSGEGGLHTFITWH
jgi:hypothetical protein